MASSDGGPELILPGDPLPQLTPLLNPPEDSNVKPKTLRLGPGLALSPSTPSTPILPYRHGRLHFSSASAKHPAASLTSTPRHYHPAIQDAVLVTLIRSTVDAFTVQLTPYTPPATIPYENYIINNAGTTAVGRKARPNIPIGATIYARVTAVHKHLEAVELTVPSPEYGEVLSHKSSSTTAAAVSGTQKDKDTATGAPAGGGTARAEVTPYILSISQPMVKVLSAEDSFGKPLLAAVSARIPFEMIVGRNGRVWIDASTQQHVINVARIFKTFDDSRMWDDDDAGASRVKGLVNQICIR